MLLQKETKLQQIKQEDIQNTFKILMYEWNICGGLASLNRKSKQSIDFRNNMNASK